MFYIVLLLLILLGVIAIVMAIQNFAILLSSVHLTLISWHLPGIPVLLLCLLGAFLGGLLLYVVSSFSARRDAQEIKKLRERVAEFEQSQLRSPSGSLSGNFAPPAIPIPGFSPSGPLPQRPLPSGPLPQRQPPSSPLQNLSSSAPFSSRPLSDRQGPPPPLPPQTGVPRPPFFQQ